MCDNDGTAYIPCIPYQGVTPLGQFYPVCKVLLAKLPEIANGMHLFTHIKICVIE